MIIYILINFNLKYLKKIILIKLLYNRNLRLIVILDY